MSVCINANVHAIQHEIGFRRAPISITSPMYTRMDYARESPSSLPPLKINPRNIYIRPTDYKITATGTKESHGRPGTKGTSQTTRRVMGRSENVRDVPDSGIPCIIDVD